MQTRQSFQTGLVTSFLSFQSNNMAEPGEENDSSIIVRDRSNVEPEETNTAMDRQLEPPANQVQNQAAPQQEGTTWKSMIVRMVIFWLVINFFRSKGPSTTTTTTNENSNQNSGPCSNLFRDGDRMVRLIWSILTLSNKLSG